MITLPDKELLRVDEVAAVLRVSKKTIYRWIDLGKIDHVRPYGKILIKKAEILKAISGEVLQ